MWKCVENEKFGNVKFGNVENLNLECGIWSVEMCKSEKKIGVWE